MGRNPRADRATRTEWLLEGGSSDGHKLSLARWRLGQSAAPGRLRPRSITTRGCLCTFTPRLSRTPGRPRCTLCEYHDYFVFGFRTSEIHVADWMPMIDHEFFPLQEERDLHTADEAGFIYCTLMNHRIKRIKYDTLVASTIDCSSPQFSNTLRGVSRKSHRNPEVCRQLYCSTRGMSDGGPGPRGAAPAETSAQSGDSPDAAPVAQPPKLIKSVWKPEVRPRDSRTAGP